MIHHLRKNLRDMLHDRLWSDAVHAGIVATAARLLSIDTAGATVKGNLDGILRALVPPHETRIGMGGTPHTHYRCGYEGGQMHIGRVHREHHLEMTHQNQFLSDGVQILRHMDALLELVAPQWELLILLRSSAKEENLGIRIFLCQQGDHLLHQSGRVDLSFMGCERSDTDVKLRVESGERSVIRKQAQVATPFREDRVEIEVDGEP